MHISGLPVVDAKTPLIIRINKRDVKLGHTKDPGACAAARCLLRSVPKIQAARVHLSRSYIQIGNTHWVRYATPQSLRSEVVSFDRGGKFLPGAHALLPLTEGQLPSGRRQGGKDRPKRRKGKKRAYHVVTGVRFRKASRSKAA